MIRYIIAAAYELDSTDAAPQRARWFERAAGRRGVKYAHWPVKGRVKNLIFEISRGVVLDFRATTYDGEIVGARAVEDPALVAEIDAANAAVETAQRALEDAQRARQETFELMFARGRKVRADEVEDPEDKKETE
jgi:hypothetical protein